MELFNQLTLCNILNGRNDLGTPELRAAVASMSEEQKDDVLVFLECNTEELAGLPNGRGIQAVANCKSLLDYYPLHWSPTRGPVHQELVTDLRTR